MTPPATRRYRAAAGTPRRRPRVRRASARLTPVRAGAILTMLVAAGGIYGLAATPAFGFDRLTIAGNTLTPSAAIRDRIAIPPGTNLVGLSTQPIVDRLRDLPAIGDAEVSVGLPDVLQVVVHERRPVVLWAVGEHRFAVDGDGLLFADVGADPPPGIADVPVVVDQRASAAGLAIRSVLDPVDVEAARRLASLTPGQIGSRVAWLRVVINDGHGFMLTSGPGGWLAVFGKYGRSERTPAMIPGEVQTLAALLADREESIQTIFLSDERNGTYLPKPSSRPSPDASARP
jgi:cell division septal protein FtsQ